MTDVAQSAANSDIIWCEQPIASKVHDAEGVVNACDQNRVKLVINHSFRFASKQQTLRRLIQEENILGDIQSVSPQFRTELMRNSTHLLDTLVHLLYIRAKRVSGYINGENEAVDTLKTGQEVDDAGGGGYVVMGDGRFVTIDCTIPASSHQCRYSSSDPTGNST